MRMKNGTGPDLNKVHPIAGLKVDKLESCYNKGPGSSLSK